ncbi:LysR family transcriptional regulator [Aciduricibacillus chroicocephali]|uniref:LysR family transcriptional regulator n=1 Tax=Aciduricibacillus chroicocephali TaxID=3054939 RepID=A0ABY9KZE9_9BACI|nr:LysR family transcriptional regulator [Bacillaceae bacterium 44XB]
MDQQLKVFVTVAEKKSFSRTAEELHMTQPAVSQYIRAFEETMGTRLLERTNKYVRLNKAGEIVYHHAKEIIGLYEKMHNLVDDLTKKARGPLTIGASHTFGEYVLPWIIATLQREYPDIEPEVIIGNTTEIANLVDTHQLDAGIVEGKLLNHHLELQPLGNDFMYAVASPDHPIFNHGNELLELEATKDMVWIAREKGSGTREAMDEMFEQFEFEPVRLMQFGSNQPIKEAVKAGLGISLLSRWAIQKELEYGELKMVKIAGLPFERQFSIITNSPFQTKALEVFTALLRSHQLLRAFE